ncbi:MAG TPA: hypothetical protein VJY62_03140 [Bacteroidia bacterium]|nr:hypothetical protein [Bacteroidia bacterium]
MHKKIIKFTMTLIILGMLSSCKKKDYREDYVGHYQFVVEETEYNNIDSIYSDTLINFLGEIDYGIDDNEISIHYLPNTTIYPILDEDGNLSSSGSGQGSSFGGKFETKNKVTFGGGTGSAVEGTTYQVSGIKQ